MALRNRTLAEVAGALADNHVDIAKASLSRYLEKKPGDPDAMNLLAETARREKRFEDAELLLSRCVNQSPKCSGFRFNYSVVLRQLHKYEQALAQIDILLGNDARNPLYRDQKAIILTRMGRFGEALACRRELAAEFPESSGVWLHFGHALRDEGFQAECIAAFHKALELDPSSTAAYASLAGLKVYRFTSDEIGQMEKQLPQPVCRRMPALTCIMRSAKRIAMPNSTRNPSKTTPGETPCVASTSVSTRK